MSHKYDTWGLRRVKRGSILYESLTYKRCLLGTRHHRSLSTFSLKAFLPPSRLAIANHCDLQWLHRTHHWPTSLHTLWLQTSLVNDFMMLFLLAWSCRKRQKATKRSENPWPSGKIWSGEQVSAEDVQRAPWLGCILESHTCRNYLVTMATRKEPPTFAVHSQNKSQFFGLPCQKDMMCLLKQCGTVTSH